MRVFVWNVDEYACIEGIKETVLTVRVSREQSRNRARYLIHLELPRHPLRTLD